MIDITRPTTLCYSILVNKIKNNKKYNVQHRERYGLDFLNPPIIKYVACNGPIVNVYLHNVA